MSGRVFQRSWFYRILLMLLMLSMVAVSCSAPPATDEAAEPAQEAETVEEEEAVAPAEEDVTASDEPVELTITTWTSDETQLGIFNEIAEEYKIDHPNVSVSFTSIPFGDYVSKVTIQLAGSDPPDAGWIVDSTAPTFINAGVLVDLGPTLESFPGYDLTDFADGPMKLWTRDDAVYGVPFSTSPYIIYYNRDLFAEAGMDTPDVLLANGEWTWDALREASKAISDATASTVYGFQSFGGDIFGSRLWQTMGPLMKAFGGQAWNDEGTQCTINSPEAVAAFEFMHAMTFEDGSAVPPGEIGDFFAGNAGMTIAMIGRTSLLADAAFEWDVISLPSGPAGYNPIVGQAAFVVFKTGQHSDVAADFIAFMTTSENVEKYSLYFPPARRSIIYSEDFLHSNSLVTPESMELAIANSIESGTVEVVHPEYPKIDLAAHGEIDKIWQPDADIQVILDAACDAIQPFMLP
ncbi:MAG: sugar ABC transporter substrate-binding protein [Anaerolineales bacterium]|nr:sugar ABC transporter substrate-binding protein [Anaerolineales bacterium]